MASLLAEQLEFDFFAPPEHEKPKADKKPAVSTAIKDTDILNYQLNRDGSRKLQDFGEDLHNTRKGRSLNRSTEPYKFIQGSPEELEKRLSSEPLDKIWPKSSILELHKDNPEAAACLWLVRSTLRGRRPAKDTYKFRRYLHTASAAIALHRQVINGELAAEAPTDAFDHFYEVGNKYKVLAHISTKYWPFIGAYSIGDAQDICRWNDFRLSDDTDIESYQYQCILPGSRDNKQLCLKNSDGKLFPYYAVAVGNSEKEFEANIEKQLKTTFGKLLETASQPEKEQESKPKPALSIKLYGRGVRNSHTYEVYGKSGTIEFQLTDKIAFESDEAFWNYVNTHRTELENKYREFRAEFSKTEKDWRSGSPIRDRVGPDYRKGKDATPEMFMSTFGFRGVEFGNWVKQGKNGRERQWMLNNAYDSLMDLSQVLGIPPKAVALDGELGLCFGSRGHGSASAHYEPVNRLINLTKTKGYSCLAHEWFHALDHYLMRTNYREKLDVRMLSEQVDSEVIFKLTPKAQERINEGGKKIYSLWMGSASRVEYELKTNPKAAELARRVVAGELDQADINLDIADRGRELVYKVTLTKEDLLQTERGAADKIRPELHHAWAETIDTIRSTAMHRRMLKKKAYWNSKTEEAARSFEAFVEVRSQELGITNDFLTNGAFVEKTLDKESYYPYLDGVDVRRVSEKFKALFEEIKSKETEKGVALFSKTREGKSGAKISEIREALDKKFGKTTIDALIDNGRLKIVSGINDVLLSPLPQELKNSQKNTKTGFIVPDELAHEGNTTGCIAVFHPAVTGEIPSGEIVVLPGHHRPFIHSGKGAKHLTGSVIEDPKRNLFPQEENKTEASLKTVLQILASANEIYKEGQGKNDSYHFYSRKLGLAVCTYFDGNKFVVLTQKPVKNPENIWGKKLGGLKGALEFPFNRDSVHLPSSIQDTGGNQTEHQPATAHEATYTSVDYTAKIFADIQRAKNRYKSEDIKGVQGFYSSQLKTSFLIADNLLPEAASSVLLHEVGVHMAYDSELKEKVIPLVKEAPRLLEEGFRQRDPVCMAAEIRLKDSGITKDHPNYAEETAAYLVEECSKQRNALPKLQRWYKQMRSTVSVWLVEHGFKDSKTLTTDDFVTIAKANIKALAEQKELTASQTKNEKILFSLNKQHRDTLELMRKELPKADPAMQNPKLLEKVLQAVEERMLDCERQGKILKVNSEFFKRQTPASRTQTEQKIPEQNKTKGLER